MRTGDLILFNGKSVVSWGIKRVLLTRFSHVGMVVELKELDLMALFESTTLSNVEDAESGEAERGVMITPLSNRIRMFKGKTYYRHLVGDLSELQIARLAEFRDMVRGRPYERSQAELIKSRYDGPGGKNEEDLSSIFCSELVVAAYRAMGIVEGDTPSNEFTPKNLAHKMIEKYLVPEYELEQFRQFDYE